MDLSTLTLSLSLSRTNDNHRTNTNTHWPIGFLFICFFLTLHTRTKCEWMGRGAEGSAFLAWCHWTKPIACELCHLKLCLFMYLFRIFFLFVLRVFRWVGIVRIYCLKFEHVECDTRKTKIKHESLTHTQSDYRQLTCMKSVITSFEFILFFSVFCLQHKTTCERLSISQPFLYTHNYEK